MTSISIVARYTPGVWFAAERNPHTKSVRPVCPAAAVVATVDGAAGTAAHGSTASALQEFGVFVTSATHGAEIVPERPTFCTHTPKAFVPVAQSAVPAEKSATSAGAP